MRNIGVVSADGDRRRVMVVIFLRGGADGLTLVPPVEDDNYYRSRPRLGVKQKDAVRLDGVFGLHPLLGPLRDVWADGQLAVVPAAGSEDDSRSHFDAQDYMEHGGVAAGGWLGRFLRYRRDAGQGPLTAVALGRKFPECLRGAPAVTVMESMEDFSLGDGGGTLGRELAGLYEADSGVLAQAGRDTLAALGRIERMQRTAYRAANGAVYGSGAFSRGLQQAAQLIKARVGLEAVALDLENWDSHFTQQTIMDPLMKELGEGLRAFWADLGPEMINVTVIAMTEFGRRVEENSSFGTDHGCGSVMFLMGGGIKGGRAVGQWPGLSADLLTGPGDVPVVNNYRDVLGPVLARHGGELGKVFPGWDGKVVGVY